MLMDHAAFAGKGSLSRYALDSMPVLSNLMYYGAGERKR